MKTHSILLLLFSLFLSLDAYSKESKSISFRTSVIGSAIDTLPQTKYVEIDEDIYKVVEQMPRFPGCETMTGSDKDKEECSKKLMLDFVYNNLVYPKEDKENQVQGMAVVQFIISKEGEVINPKVTRSLSESTDISIINMLNSMNTMEEKWIPGKQRGNNVYVLYTLPIRFKPE